MGIFLDGANTKELLFFLLSITNMKITKGYFITQMLPNNLIVHATQLRILPQQRMSPQAISGVVSVTSIESSYNSVPRVGSGCDRPNQVWNTGLERPSVLKA